MKLVKYIARENMQFVRWKWCG